MAIDGIELTRLEDGLKTFINKDHVIAVAPKGNHTIIHAMGVSPSIMVVENYQTVKTMLEDKGSLVVEGLPAPAGERQK